MDKISFCLKENHCQNAFVVHGLDGMDEITTTNNSLILEIKNNQIQELKTLNPQDYGIKKCQLSDLKGKDAKYNARKIIDLLNNEQSAYKDIVLLNSAVALLVANKCQTIDQGIKIADENIKNNNAKRTLEKIKNG